MVLRPSPGEAREVTQRSGERLALVRRREVAR